MTEEEKKALDAKEGLTGTTIARCDECGQIARGQYSAYDLTFRCTGCISAKRSKGGSK